MTTKKREVTSDVYASTLEFLEERLRLYTIFLDSARTEKTIERYTTITSDYQDILDFFKENYTQRRRKAQTGERSI